MAVNSSLTANTLVLKLKVGVDQEGKDVFKTQRFSKIKSLATDENMFSVGKALANLAESISHEILKECDYQLMEE